MQNNATFKWIPQEFWLVFSIIAIYAFLFKAFDYSQPPFSERNKIFTILFPTSIFVFIDSLIIITGFFPQYHKIFQIVQLIYAVLLTGYFFSVGLKDKNNIVTRVCLIVLIICIITFILLSI